MLLLSDIMKAIKIIKHKQSKDEPPVETPARAQNPVNPTPNHLVHTIKGWIAETRERKRTQRLSLTALGALILITFAITMAQTPQVQTTERSLTTEERAIKVTIATTAGFLGQPAKRYRVGERYRRLTNVEYARIQGFPDEHCRVVSVYSQYALFGAAVPPPMAEWALGRATSDTREIIVPEEEARPKRRARVR